VLLNKWYVDEIYDFLFVNGSPRAAARWLAAFDRRAVDGGVNGAGWLTRFVSSISIWWDTWIMDGAGALTAFSVKLLFLPGPHSCRPATCRPTRCSLSLGVLVFFRLLLVR
jgi:NADH-quinone oxidoreductase subunit L